jgi:ribokinase
MKKILVIGSLNMDIQVAADRLPGVGETVLGKDYSYNSGGKGANQALAAGRLGADVVMLGCVGQDEFGRTLIRGLTENGVCTDYIALREGEDTGTAVILVDSQANNSIVTIAGANGSCNIPYLEQTEPLILDYEYLLLQMEIPADAVFYAINRAKEAGKTIILNPAPAPDGLPEEIMRNIDIITPNESELARLSRQKTDSLEEILEGAEKLLSQGVGHVIVTMGKKGALWVSSEGHRMFEGTKVDAFDTTGAGDCFNGALAVKLAEGKSMEEAICFANAAAAISVTRKGAQASMPHKEEVLRLMQEE